MEKGLRCINYLKAEFLFLQALHCEAQVILRGCGEFFHKICSFRFEVKLEYICELGPRKFRDQTYDPLAGFAIHKLEVGLTDCAFPVIVAGLTIFYALGAESSVNPKAGPLALDTAGVFNKKM